MKAIIMAGGEGSRLRPLTEDSPKPLAPIVGRPCICHIIDLLHKHGITEIAATVMYKKERLTDLLLTNSISIYEEKLPLGTAGSVKQCEKFVSDPFMVISGDCVCDFDLTAAIRFHEAHGGIATLLLSEVKNPLEYGVCVTNDDGLITRFIEKPSWERAYSGTVNTGIYILSRKVLDYIEKDKKTDFSKDVFPLLMKNGESIYGYHANGYWCDIGSLDAYLRCNTDILAGRAKIEYPQTKRLKGAKITQPCYIGKNVTAAGATIGPYTVLGDNVHLMPDAHVEKSVLLSNVTVAQNAFVKNAVVGSGSKVGQDATVGDYSVLGSFCVVGDRCAVAAKTRVYAKNILPVDGVVSGTVVRGIKTTDICDAFQEPQALVSLGSALCRQLGKNLCLGGDDKIMPRQALCAGMLGAGASVSDFGECDKNAFAYILRKKGFDGGVFSGCDRIYFFEGDGLPLSHTAEKSLKKHLETPFTSEKCGDYTAVDGYTEIYEQKLKKHLMGIESVPFFLYAPDFFCSLVTTEPTENAERFYIGDEVGVDDHPTETVMNAVCLAFGKTYGKVYIPYSYPTTAEKIASENGFEVFRLTLEDSERRRLFDICDPNISGAVLLRYLTKNNLHFDELIMQLPPTVMFFREVFGADEKCNIMKRLLSVPTQKKELVEGIKFIDGDAAVHILPHDDLHGFRVVAQAQNAEAAREICDFYVNKIKMVDNDKYS